MAVRMREVLARPWVGVCVPLALSLSLLILTGFQGTGPLIYDTTIAYVPTCSRTLPPFSFVGGRVRLRVGCHTTN